MNCCSTTNDRPRTTMVYLTDSLLRRRPSARWRLVLALLAVTGALAIDAAGQARPTNYQQDGRGTDDGGGVLRFRYTWDSSSGNLADLNNCQVGENVAYPGNNDPYMWNSPPYAQGASTPNPTIIWMGATGGALVDRHSPPRNAQGDNWRRPYRADNVTATQAYR